MKKTKIDISSMARSCCAGFEPYVAGKPIETIKRELGLSKVIKLASNENPLGPSQRAVAAMKKAAASGYYYPDSNVWALKTALAKKFGVDTGNLVIGAGSDELIELLAKTFFTPDDNIVVSEHAFIRYAMAGKLMGVRVITVPMKDNTHDLPAMAQAVNSNTKAVFIANPNNPTGTYITRKEFDAFMAALAARRGCMPLVVMDEAYYEYALSFKDYPRTLPLLSKYPNLVILRTFSKIYGLAGLRVGYGFADKAVIDYLERIRPPFNINSLAQAAAVASIGDNAQVEKSRSLVEKEKEKLCGELDEAGIAYLPSAANFLLIEVAPAAGKDIFKKLLAEGVIVRAMDEYDYPNHIRVSVGLPRENKQFLRAFRKVMKL